MAKVEIDPIDGLMVDVVGPWASEKHQRLSEYIKLARGARASFVPPRGTGGASYIELFSASGRSLIEGTSTYIDGSPLVAYKAAQASGVRFSDLHFNDIEPTKTQALDTRIRALGGAAIVHNKPAQEAIDDIVFALNPSGLHFAFLDPYNLEYLSFEIIEKLARFKHMDMLVHVSVQDLQRNLDRYSVQGGALDKFAPGWRSRVNPNQANNAFRAALMEYWLDEIRKLGTMPAHGVELVVGSKGQRLYWLMFVAAHDLAQKLWNAVRNPGGQREMGF
ncbi:three-Cys-motif partner protein TcmP [Bradyrhizobium sp. SSUT112]|uniref:three-Cys-motif partner protein TcmP n=1 Tax=Bradyrhizobium sp. SSUT112 TaxID=3040604 RepID=UPI002448BF49|nr:three-Cys-motif partner protein TcmP [Bradyrhizobium sp. SSUT112]MDH2352986.1 three-Cys-motif partner protein TcmP [Bradyrhizobium sp. SSUT112]